MRSRAPLYEQLLPTLGPRVVPALFGRLKKAALAGDRELLRLAADAIASAGGGGAGPAAAALLDDPSPLARRAAMRVLALKPAAGCLDRLWDIHCQMDSDRQPYLFPEERPPSVYSDSFAALLACVRQEPGWLEGAARRATPAEPVHDLAYLLGNLDGQEALWLACKADLLAKIPSRRERSLASNIYRHRDASEAAWLVERVDREDDMLGAWAIRALCRIDPDLAARELARLPPRLWGPSARWCFREVMRHRPAEARACLLAKLAEPGATDIVTVYQDDSGAVDVATVEALLDRLAQVLADELAQDPPPASPEFFVLCQLLAGMNRLEQLQAIEGRRGSPLEERLAGWLLKVGPITGQAACATRDCARRVLGKVGGAGYTRVINAHLASENFYARTIGYRIAARRPDGQTVDLLLQHARKEELHPEAGPAEQGFAAVALADIGESRAAVESVVRWGLATLESVPRRLAEMPLDDDALAPALEALAGEAGAVPAGAILAIGTGRRSERRGELAGRVRAILRAAPADSEAARACLIALRLLHDQAEEAVGLATPHLDVPAHARDAATILARVGTDAALDALLGLLRRALAPNGRDAAWALEQAVQGWGGLIVFLLDQPRTAEAVSAMIGQAVEACWAPARPGFIGRVLVQVPDARPLEKAFGDAAAAEALHEAAYARPGGIWFAGSRAAAIRCLARFDPVAAREAAAAALLDRDARDRERYPALLAEIDPAGAVPLLMELMRAEEDMRVKRAAGRAAARLAGVAAAGLAGRLAGWARDADASRRRAACWLMGWVPALYKPDAPGLRAALGDPDESVAAAADEALARLRDEEHAWTLADAIAKEADGPRRWRLLCCLISLADPGDDYGPPPRWAEQVCQVLPPALLHHLRAVSELV